MCTVSFAPTSNTNFVLTSNRDEQLKRKSALVPQIENINGVNVLYPKDGEKGGTWIGATNQNRVICLLNGAFIKHTTTPPYAKSRGIVVKDLLICYDIKFTLNQYDLNNIEPFTLVIVEYDDNLNLIEFRWDGNIKHFNYLNTNEVHIWSSCTLYSNSEATHKEKKFKAAIKPNFKNDDIINFHEYGTKTEPLLMTYTANPLYGTISITQIIKSSDCVEMKYKDTLSQIINKQTIKSKVCKKVEL